LISSNGLARLKGQDLRARAEALIAIAHPHFRDELAKSL
jgi:itaconate CoA-transferase